jgi:hypothetical protein
MAYGDRYYALNPADGKWYTTDAQGNQLYKTSLPVDPNTGQPVDVSTGNPLSWKAVQFKENRNATSPDPLSGTAAQQNPVTSGQGPTRVVQGGDASVSTTGQVTNTGTQTVTYQAPTTGTGGVSYQTDQSGVFYPTATGTPYNRTRNVKWPDGQNLPEQTAKGYLYQLRQTNPDQYAAIVNRMEQAGWDVSSAAKVQQNWENVVGKAADAFDSGYQGLDPFVAIDLYSDRSGIKAAGEGGPSAQIQTVSSISSKSEARGVLIESYKNLLGRDPSDKEVNAFTTALNSLEQSRPKTTTTVSSQAEQGVVSGGQEVPTAVSSSVTTGGFDKAQYAVDYAKSASDFAEYQAATTYMDALLSAIQSPVNI